jgi:hypothetical protein
MHDPKNKIVQYTFTHKQYTEYSSTSHIYTQTVTQNTENGTYVTIKENNYRYL